MNKLAKEVRKITIVIDTKEYNRLKKFSWENKKTVSELIRHGISIVLNNKTKRKKKA